MPAPPETTRFFRACGNQSLCVLPLRTPFRQLGALCTGRDQRDLFSEEEGEWLMLLSFYAAAALDDRINFLHAEQQRVRLEREETNLKLILDLHNSVVSDAELRDVLQAV